jgi:DNA-binding GntR family transcriptional regulator
MVLLTNDSPLRVRVFQTLENAILQGDVENGSSLNEIKIANDLGVSRTPVREALMQLELEGLITNVPNKGAVVNAVSKKDIEDIYEMRIRIEGLASRLCAKNMTDEQIKAMSEIVELQEFYLEKGNADKIWELDTKFHKAIYEGSGSKPLDEMLSNLHNYIKRARDISINTAGRAEKAVEEHRAIMDAISAHDENMAEKLTMKHISNARDNVLAHYC